MNQSNATDSIESMKVFLHLGAHKTGTTLLQRYLAINREHLETKGVKLLLLRETMQILGSWGKNLCDHPALLTDVLFEMQSSGAKKVIISCEDLLGLPFKKGTNGLYPTSEARFSALQKALKGHDVTAIIYIRPQEEFLESWYLQTINMGHSHSFEEWLKSINLESISWKSVIDNIQTSLRPAKVIVEDFRVIRSGAEEFVRRFARHLGIPDLLKFPKAQTHNVSLSGKGLKLALMTYPILEKTEKVMMRKFLQSKFSNRDFPRPELLSAAEKAAIASRWGPEIQNLLGFR